MSMQLTTFNKTALGITLSLTAEISPLHVGSPKKVLPKHSMVIFSLKKFEKLIVAYIDIPVFL